jgi:hypothetical protein
MYDRLNDNSEDGLPRLLDALVIKEKAPEHAKSVMEWPVARVDELSARFPKHTSSQEVTQDGETVERRMVPITKAPDPTTEIGKAFKVPVVGITLPL